MGRYERGLRRRNRPRGLTRREFIAGTTAAGLFVGMPSWLAGCGDDDGSRPGATPTPSPSPTPGPRPCEECTLNFDFSGVGLEDLEIRVVNSEDDGARIQEHTAESRAHFRNEDPVLAEVADEDLTHYVENITLPSDALQLYWITGCLESGEDALAGLNIHVPQAAMMALAETAAARGVANVRTAKMRRYGIGLQQQQNPAELYANLARFVNNFDSATALLFMQPDLLNINVMQGGSILQLLQTLPCTGPESCDTAYIDTLAFLIESRWPATESGVILIDGEEVPAWARLVPVRDDQGNLVMQPEGGPAYSYEVSDEVAETAASVARDIRKVILNSPEFEGFNWHPTHGLTTEENGVAVASSRSRVFMGGLQQAPPQVQVVGEHPQGATAHGVEFTRIAVVDQAKRTVEVEVRNHFIRFVSAFVRFANETEDLSFSPGSNDTSRSRFLGLINSNFTVVGVPLLGDSVEKQKFSFDIPPEATKARLYLGSLGVGGEAFSPEAVSASVATLGFNIGIPVMMLATGAAANGIVQGNIRAFLANAVGKEALKQMVVRTIALAGPQVLTGIYGTKNSGNARPVLISLANALVTFIFSGGVFTSLLIQIGLNLISSQIATIAGPLGMAFKAIAVGADAATLAQTVAEVLANPAIFTNVLSLQMSTEVTISHDPLNATFPARARRYEVTLTYDTASKTAHKMTGTIEANQSDPIVVLFAAVPSGGMVSVEVLILADDDTIVGGSTDANGDLGAFGPIANNVDTAGKVGITIKEQLVPLATNTRYHHQRKLAYQSGARVWVDRAPAPTATRGDLCQGQDDRLCNLVGVTVSQRSGNLGYGFQAGAQGVSFCGEAAGGVMYRVQNISLAAGSDRNFKELPCGFREPAGILYDRLGAPDGRGRNFFVRPAADGFYLQSMVLDATTPLTLSPLSWGRFSQPMDALALHPMGFVIGVNRNNHKMEILQLPAAAVDGAVAPDAIPFAVQKAGEGDRPGLLRAPVALTVFEGAILVLETGNARVQALDVSGNPVNLFAGGTSPTFALAGSGATYLDIGADGVGYVYVLSFNGTGANPADYHLEIYTPDGVFLSRTPRVAAGRFTVDTFRSVYTLNYETLAGAPRVEPSLSHWVPVTPR